MKLSHEQRVAIQAANAAKDALDEMKRAIRRGDYSPSNGVARWEQDALTHISVVRDCLFGEG